MTGLIGTCIAAIPLQAHASALDPIVAIQSWQQVRHGLNQNASAMPRVDQVSVEGVHITLSHNQRPVAWATSTTWGGATHPIAQATMGAMQSARRDPLVRDLPRPLQDDALTRLAVEVEIAGPLEPITAPTLRDAANALLPATDGIALRINRQWFIRFPSYLRMTGDGATYEELKSLAIAARMTPSELDAARRSGQATLYRFKTVDLLQDAHKDPARLYIRGEESPRVEYDRESLIALGQRVANRLASQLVTPDLDLEDAPPSFLMGDYDAAAGRHISTKAPLRDHMLAALAFTKWKIATDADAEQWAAVTQALTMTTSKTDLKDPIDAAMYAMLIRSAILPDDPTHGDIALEIADRQDLPLTVRAIAGLGLPPQSPIIEEVLMDGKEAEPEQLFNALPWIGWLDLQNAMTKGQPLILNDQWRTIEYMLEDRQRDTGPLQGAIGFNEHVESISAHMLRPLAFYLSLPAKPAPWTVDAMTFVSTLIVPSAHHPFRGAASADGIRLAPWDDRMPVWTQAMTLLCLSELLESGFGDPDSATVLP